MQSCIVLFCGLPGSGKTTITKEIEASLYDKYEFHVISFDELLSLELQKKLVNETDEWKKSRQQVLRASELYVCKLTDTGCSCTTQSLQPIEKSHFEVLMKRNSQRNHENVCFLVEDNFYYSSMRYEWFQMARKYGLGYCQVYLDCTPKTAKARNCNRINNVPDQIIQRMSEKAEKPCPESNTWEKHSVVLDTNSLERHVYKLHLKEIFVLMDRALEDPVKQLNDRSLEVEQSRLISSQSVVHQVDLRLRKLVSVKMANLKDVPDQDPQKAFIKLKAISQSVKQKLVNECIGSLDQALKSMQISTTPGSQSQDLVRVIEQEFEAACAHEITELQLPSRK